MMMSGSPYPTILPVTPKSPTPADRFQHLIYALSTEYRSLQEQLAAISKQNRELQQWMVVSPAFSPRNNTEDSGIPSDPPSFLPAPPCKEPFGDRSQADDVNFGNFDDDKLPVLGKDPTLNASVYGVSQQSKGVSSSSFGDSRDLSLMHRDVERPKQRLSRTLERQPSFPERASVEILPRDVDRPKQSRLSSTDPTRRADASGARKSLREEMLARSQGRATTQYYAGRQLDNRSRAMFLLETVPVVVIILNACTIGMSADIEPKAQLWKWLERLWVAFYTCEFLIKLAVLRFHGYFCETGRYWNFFDLFCLVLSYGDILISIVVVDDEDAVGGGALAFIKMLRLARLARIVRALHFPIFEELKQMVLGVVSGVRVLIWAIVLLMITIFFCGVACNSLFSDQIDEMKTVPNAMFTVFRCFTDGCTDYHGKPLAEELLRKYGVVWFFAYILTFMFVTVGIFNLIMAIFIENVVGRGLKRKLQELGASTEATEVLVKETLVKLIHSSHPDYDNLTLSHSYSNSFSKLSTGDAATLKQAGGGRASKTSIDYEKAFDQLVAQKVPIPRELFNQWLDGGGLPELLERAHVEVAEKQGLFDVLDVDMGGELGLDELITGIMRLRGPITKSDIVAVRLKVNYMIAILEEGFAKIVPELIEGLREYQYEPPHYANGKDTDEYTV